MVLTYLCAAALGGLIPGRSADLPEGDTTEIGLLFGPIHVDLLLPATPETLDRLAFARAADVPLDDPRVGYVIIGWGARDFYIGTPQWADLSVGATWRAVTGDSAVYRIDVAGQGVDLSQLPTLRLSSAQYTALLDRIAADATATAVPAEGHGPNAGFVAAQGRFHIFRTCNTWAGRTLRAAGVPMGLWTPTPYSVRLSLWRAGLN